MVKFVQNLTLLSTFEFADPQISSLTFKIWHFGLFAIKPFKFLYSCSSPSKSKVDLKAGLKPTKTVNREIESSKLENVDLKAIPIKVGKVTRLYTDLVTNH